MIVGPPVIVHALEPPRPEAPIAVQLVAFELRHRSADPTLYWRTSSVVEWRRGEYTAWSQRNFDHVSGIVRRVGLDCAWRYDGDVNHLHNLHVTASEVITLRENKVNFDAQPEEIREAIAALVMLRG